MDHVLFEKNNSVGWLILNNPDTRNALSLEVIEEINIKLHMIADDKDINVLVIRGNGPAFCAGHNLKELSERQNDIHYVRTLFTKCSEMMMSLHKLPQPVIAQVHGVATAAGCQLVAACDLAICESSARFATPGVGIGLFCSTPMVPLCRVIGRRRALEMLLSGRLISAQEAKEYGLVNRVVPNEQLSHEAKTWAMDLAQSSRFTLAFGKHAFYSQIDMAEGDAYNYAKEAISLNCFDDDAKEGIKAFLEKREPVWKKR